MQSEKETCKKLSKLFEKAAESLEYRKHKYICLAITRLQPADIRKEALSIIRTRLGPGKTYLSWIVSNYPELVESKDDLYVQEKAREGRINWLRNLSIEYKNKGKQNA